LSKKLNGSDIIVECLLEQGVDTVFGYPGGAVLNIYDALYKYSDKINHILTSHEQNACHGADGYARTTGKTGVVIATSGPGATNLVTGIANMDSIPMVAITGNVGTSLLGLDSFQEADIVAITKPITKKNYQVTKVEDLADTIREAFYIANEGRKGVVLIDIPKDVSANFCEFENKPVKKYEYIKDSTVDSQIAKAVETIKNAKRPYIYAGGGVVSSNAVDLMREFVYKVDAPVSLSLMGQCAFDNTDPRYLGMLGMHGTKTSSLALKDCDLMVVLGSRFSDRVSCNTNTFKMGQNILHIDIDTKEIDKNISSDSYVLGDLTYILKELNAKLPQLDHSEWLETINQWKQEYPLTMHPTNLEDVDAVLPKDVLETLDRLTDGNAILSTEVGQHQMWAAEYYNFKYPRTFATSGGFGTMGYGLGASIGAKVGNPDKTVVNIAGDGSFYMNLTELSTLARYDIPVIELVFNNSVLGMVRQWQRLFYGKRFSQTVIDKGTDFVKLGESFGVKSLRITKKSDIEPVLKEALSCGKPCLIDCWIDKDINVLPMVPAGASVYEPIMDIVIDD
jgi:acetolactate synthase-1/2/3 large subunit